MLDIGDDGEVRDISSRSLDVVEGFVIMWRKVERIAVAVESEPAMLGFRLA